MTGQIEKITHEWQNKIKQIADQRTIKQHYTYIKSECYINICSICIIYLYCSSMVAYHKVDSIVCICRL